MRTQNPYHKHLTWQINITAKTMAFLNNHEPPTKPISQIDPDGISLETRNNNLRQQRAMVKAVRGTTKTYTKKIKYKIEKKNMHVYLMIRMWWVMIELVNDVWVLVSLARLIGTIHNICKVRYSNSGHQKKKLMMCEWSIVYLSVNCELMW